MKTKVKTIIAYNIDFSTLVTDESIPDSKCNVMKWGDHISCLVKGSNITIDGFGIEIQNLHDGFNKILSHSDETNDLEYKYQTNFFNQGKKECVKITYEDGTNIICTPDHKIMTSENKWIEAKDILIKKTKIKKSITFPKTNFEDYICDFSLDFGTLKLNMSSVKEVKRFSLFCRLFGMIYTNGSINNNKATIYTGDIVDTESVLNDIEFVCGVKPNYKFMEGSSGSKYFHICVPFEFHNSSLWKIGDCYGSRMDKESKLPEFITDKNCPIILKRELLAGMFGGDGSPPNYSDKQKKYHTISFCKSKNNSHLENLKNFMESLQYLLLNNFNIRSYLNGPYEKKDTKDCFTTFLNINLNDVILFNDLVGFRYCIYKSFKLEAFCSYKKLMKNVFFQRDNSFKIIKKLKETMTWDEAVLKGHEIIRNSEIILNNHYAFPNKLACIDSNRRTKNGDKITFCSVNFPSFEAYMKKIKVYDCFVDSNLKYESSIYCKNRFKLDDIPYYELEVVNIQPVGEHEVYDIEVDKNHSFLADGTVVHNCSHDPKVIRKNKLATYIDSVKKELTELRERRDKKSNKFCRQEIINEINKKVEDLKPYIEERSQLSKTISKNPMCEERSFRFLKEPKGVIPTMLQNLLDARKHTRVGIKDNKKEIEKLLDKNGDKMKINELAMMNNVLDKRQLAYKICANSVASTTPIPCKIDGMFIYKTIEEISKGDWERINEEQEVSTPIDNIEVWSDKGFTKPKFVMRHYTNEILKRIVTDFGIVICTNDHSLLKPDGREIKPSECKIGDELLHKECNLILKYYDYSLEEILEGEFYKCSSEIESAMIFNLLRKSGYNVKIDFINNEYILEYSKSELNNTNNKIKKIEDVNTPQYVYDIETENHHFAAGVGNMIVHNSMYGSWGVRRGYLPFMPGAMATCFMGRTNIEIVAKTIVEEYKGELVYGD